MELKKYLDNLGNDYLPVKKINIVNFLVEKYSTVNNKIIDEILKNNLSTYLRGDYKTFSEEVEEKIVEREKNSIDKN